MVYSVLCNDVEVGTATVDRQGLFYCICCTSMIAEPYRILLRTDTEKIELGICPPGGQITNRFSVKRVGEGELHFVATQQQSSQTMIEVDENTQFPYLTKLPQAYLRQKDSVYYIAFKEPVKD